MRSATTIGVGLLRYAFMGRAHASAYRRLGTLASLEDGYRAAEICEAIGRSAATGERQRVSCRG
jgi:predicted dehydrogenase